MTPYPASVGPDRAAEVGDIVWTLKNRSGADLKRGDVAVIDPEQFDSTGRYDSVANTDNLGASNIGIVVVALEPVDRSDFGRFLVQGYAKHVRLGGAMTLGTVSASGCVGTGGSEGTIVPATAASNKKVVFKPSASYSSGDLASGYWDGWAGFGLDIV